MLYEALCEHNPTIWEGPDARRILIFSGIFGVLRAEDMIPLHRLAMGANLPPLGKVSALWRRVLAAALNSSPWKHACSDSGHRWRIKEKPRIAGLFFVLASGPNDNLSGIFREVQFVTGGKADTLEFHG